MRPGKPITLNYEDLNEPVHGPGPGIAGSEESAGGPPDLISSVEGVLDRANTLMANVKEVVGMMRGGMPQLGQGQGSAAGQDNRTYQPQPTMQQQLHRIVNVCYSAYGDITLLELIKALAAQYGGAKLSQVLKLLEK